uniref:Uncharacterized protein n=2 Tax=Mantoniella antarctica TaxID=81844 RepID=A0A7S0SCH3_9CHLO|mmetsp:Transcript_155/g.388  ORF Transcript_155/g.388 Transcript_155/m.388 type:complete len:285 (+) Transcript_155:144-998(+)
MELVGDLARRQMGLVGDLARVTMGATKTMGALTMGAVAGVYADRSGHVDRGFAYFNIPSAPATETSPLDYVAAALGKARELSGLDSGLDSGIAAAKSIGDSTLWAFDQCFAAVLSVGGQSESQAALVRHIEQTRLENNLLLTRLQCLDAFIIVTCIGAGTLLVVQYMGPDKIQEMADESMARAREWSKHTAKWADAQVDSLGLRTHLDALQAHLSALASAICSHSASAYDQMMSILVPTVNQWMLRCARHADAAYSAMTPHVVAAQQAVRKLIAAILDYFNPEP